MGVHLALNRKKKVTLRAVILGALILFFCARVGQGQEKRSLGPDFEDLGHLDYSRRETASLALIKRGEAVLAKLRILERKSADPEIRLRSQFLIRRIIKNIRSSKTLPLKLSFIDFGAVTIGSPAQELGRRGDEQQHMVYIEKPFLMGTYEVTQAQFETVMGRNPSYFQKGGPGKARVKKLTTSQFPVDSVSWFDAIEFCNKLSRKDSLKKYYELKDIKRSKGAIISAKVKIIGGNGYRLPTESEWEYACRWSATGAARKTAYHFGDRSRGGDANFRSRRSAGAYGGKTKVIELKRSCRVGRYNPNASGLYDMHGNVSEWCWDWYKEQYPKTYRRAASGPKTGRRRVTRGGSWILNGKSCRSASRAAYGPFAVKNYSGFRVARTP
ncbi:MAG: formylglycine-generating enzyme family protein [Planctomycetota bacterium]|nr:formylglycine-generating enzyme family protein [Planctomycetota bacterium]